MVLEREQIEDMESGSWRAVAALMRSEEVGGHYSR